MTILEQQGLAAKQAARKLAIAGTAKKNEALEAVARALEAGAAQWLAANAEDVKEAEANGMRAAMLDLGSAALSRGVSSPTSCPMLISRLAI